MTRRVLPGASFTLLIPFDGDAHSAGRARAATIDLLGSQVSAATLGEVILAVTELVMNAHQHGLPPVALTVTLDHDCVEVAVADHSMEPPRLSANPKVEGGFGLNIVKAMADDWDVECLPTGKVVWCRIPIAPRTATPLE